MTQEAELYRFTLRELVDGRSSIDVISELEIRGLSSLEAEDMVERAIVELNERDTGMTVEDVRREINEIIKQTGDDESQHDDEDSLHRAVLRAIADGAPNAAELATEALKTLDLNFCRWCA